MRALLFYKERRKRISHCGSYLIILFILLFFSLTKSFADTAYSVTMSIKNDTEEPLTVSLIDRWCISNVYTGQLDPSNSNTFNVKLLYSWPCTLNPYRAWEWKISTANQKEIFLVCSSSTQTSARSWSAANNFLINCEADSSKEARGLKFLLDRKSTAVDILIKRV